MLVAPPAAGVAARARATNADGVRVLRSDAQGILLELEIPPYAAHTIGTDGHTYHRIHVDGYSLTDTPGAPELPQKGLLLGIPPDAGVTLNILAAESTVAHGLHLRPAPDQRLEPARLAPDPQIYATDAFFPSAVASIGDVGYLRDQCYVLLLVHPVQVNPVTGELRHHHHMRLQISFGYSQGHPTATSPRPESPAFESLLRDAILNADTASAWRARPHGADLAETPDAALDDAGPLSTGPGSPAEARGPNPRKVQAPKHLSPPAYKISVDRDGIYQLTYADLQAAGLPVDRGPGIDPRTFQLFNAGAEVAIYLEDAGDGTFDPGDGILFYGQGLDTKYTDTNVYWLTYGEADGLRMAHRDGTPSGTAPVSPSFATTRHLEENHDRHPRIRMVNDDRWWWSQVLAPPGSEGSQTFTFTLSHVAIEAYSVTLRADFHGRTHSDDVDPDHHARIFLNGHLAADVWWDGFADQVSAAALPSSYLLEGTNAVSVTAPNDTGAGLDAFYINWFEIDYRRACAAEEGGLTLALDEPGEWQVEAGGFSSTDIDVFDVSDPFHVSRVVSTTVLGASGNYTLTFEDAITRTAHYVALTPADRVSPLSVQLDSPSDLRDPSHGADYVVITHRDFYSDVLPLADYRAAQGLRTLVVDVQDIYDEFSYGVFEPQAIHGFLQYAYANWAPPAPSYVLLVGNGNYDFRGYASSEPNYVPPYPIYLNEDLGEAAADNRYATVSGDDVLPDLFIGRLPVSTSAEAAGVVAKILAYEQNTPEGDWNWRALFVADNVPDEAGDFVALSDDLADHYLPAPYTASRIYLNDICGEPTHAPCRAATAPITTAISDGALLVNYIGHGARDRWAHERVFDNEHIPALTNDGRLPIFLSMTCLTGDYSVPDHACLDGSLLRAKGGGAIATWSCTAEGESPGHRRLDQGFFTAVFHHGVTEIGRAAVQGKLALYEGTEDYRDLIDTYSLLGDPATRLNVPLALSLRVYLPMVVRHH
jgi:hypothetical protein